MHSYDIIAAHQGVTYHFSKSPDHDVDNSTASGKQKKEQKWTPLCSLQPLHLVSGTQRLNEEKTALGAISSTAAAEGGALIVAPAVVAVAVVGMN